MKDLATVRLSVNNIIVDDMGTLTDNVCIFAKK